MEYVINAKYFFDYSHNALFMLFLSGNIKYVFFYGALSFKFLVRQSANLHITSIELLFNCIICAGSHFLTLIDRLTT